LVFKLLYDPIYDRHELLWTNLYGFKKQDNEFWQEFYVGVNKLAKKLKCSIMSGETNNNRIISFMREHLSPFETTKLSVEVH
jgi:hypothetical protein